MHLRSLRIWWCTAVQPTCQHNLPWCMQRPPCRVHLPTWLVSVQGVVGAHLVAHGSLLSADNGHYRSLVVAAEAPATWTKIQAGSIGREISNAVIYLKGWLSLLPPVIILDPPKRAEREPVCGGRSYDAEICKQSSRGAVLTLLTYGWDILAGVVVPANQTAHRSHLSSHTTVGLEAQQSNQRGHRRGGGRLQRCQQVCLTSPPAAEVHPDIPAASGPLSKLLRNCR